MQRFLAGSGHGFYHSPAGGTQSSGGQVFRWLWRWWWWSWLYLGNFILILLQAPLLLKSRVSCDSCDFPVFDHFADFLYLGSANDFALNCCRPTRPTITTMPEHLPPKPNSQSLTWFGEKLKSDIWRGHGYEYGHEHGKINLNLLHFGKFLNNRYFWIVINCLDAILTRSISDANRK